MACMTQSTAGRQHNTSGERQQANSVDVDGETQDVQYVPAGTYSEQQRFFFYARPLERLAFERQA
jgi:hypothetical protein